MPTMTLAILPIWASVFMKMLASQPTMPPMIRVMIRFIDAILPSD